MNCPVCGEKMREIAKLNVQLDICPGCKGVWLDAGELEKIIDYSASENIRSESVNASKAPVHDRDYDRRDEHHDKHKEYDSHHDHDKNQGYGNRKKRSSWLQDILGGLGGED